VIHISSLISLQKSFYRVGRNAQISVMVQPLWAIPFCMLSAYTTLYMVGQGISETNVGFINSAAFVVKAIVALFAGHIVNVMGRKKSIITFDIISLTLFYLIMIFAVNPWQFLIANMIGGFGVINMIAQHCYLSEDVLPEDRIFTYNLLETLYIVSAFFSPVAGLLIQKFQMIPAIRMMYGFAFLCSLVFVVLKIIFLKETSIGLLKIRKINDVFDKDLLTGQWKSLKYVLKNKQLAVYITLNNIVNFALSLYTIYYFLYLTQCLKYSEMSISIFPFLTSVIGLITLIIIIPRNRIKDGLLLLCFILYVIGGISLVAAPVGNSLFFVILNCLCWAISSQIVLILLQVKIANKIDDNLRAEVMGFSNVLSMISILPTGIIGGLIYKFSPIVLFYFILLVYVLSFIIYLFGIKEKDFGILKNFSKWRIKYDSKL
jgi:MFS transporter, DHA1 family, tetracycline resistance protein